MKMKCLLCEGKVKSLERYENHLSEEHESSHGRNIVMALSFLSNMEKGVLLERVEERKKHFIEEKTFKVTSNIFDTLLTNGGDDKTVVTDKLLCDDGGGDNRNNADINVSNVKVETENSFEVSETCLEKDFEVAENSFNTSSINVSFEKEMPNEVEYPRDESGAYSSCSKQLDLECQLCFTRFTKRPNLARHLRNIHNSHIQANQTEELTRMHISRNHPDKDQISMLNVDNNNQTKSDIKLDEGRIHVESVSEHEVIQTEEESEDKLELATIHSSDESEDRDQSATADEVVENVPLQEKTVKSLITGCEMSRNQLICNLCYFNFSSEADLDSHQKLEHMDDMEEVGKSFCAANLIFPCDICDIKFLTENIVIVHKRLEHRLNVRRRTDCLLCHVNFDKEKTLECHMKTYHSSENDSFEYFSRNSKMNHKCKTCDKFFYSERSLAFHYNAVHTNNSHCDLCNLNFKSSKGLIYHKMKIHIDELVAFSQKYEEKDFAHRCNFCDSYFPTEGTAKYHMKRKHYSRHQQEMSTRKLTFHAEEGFCKLCDVKFKNKFGFVVHKNKTHLKELDAFDRQLLPEDLQHQCPFCSSMFYSLNSLKYHKTKVHNEGQFYCSICHVSFKWNTNYIEHKKKVHMSNYEKKSSEWNLNVSKQCKHCDKTFLDEKTLNYHLRYGHTQLQNMDKNCKYCKTTFKAGQRMNKQIKQHMKSVHNITGTSEEVSGGEQNVHNNFLVLINSLKKSKQTEPIAM